jgi:hypothetical protein
MAIKTKSCVSVTVEHLPLPEGGKCDDVLQVGNDLWNAVVPASARNGPVAVSVDLLQTHADNGRTDPSTSLSLTCWAVQSDDVQVSCPWTTGKDVIHPAPPDSHAWYSFRSSEAISSHPWPRFHFPPFWKDAHTLRGSTHSIARGIRASTFQFRI